MPINSAIDPRLLTLTQWLSPAYPLGSFAFSHGLESAIANGWVSDEATLKDWLQDVLSQGSGASDAAWIHMAYRAESPAEVEALNAEAIAFAPSKERLREAARQGAAFARVTSEVWRIELPNSLLPIALGRAARLVDLDPVAAATLYLQAFLGNLTSAAQRLMPLGQTGAQRVLAQLTSDCTAIAQAAVEMTPDDITSSAFLSDIAAMHHETLEPRLFQS